MTRCGQFIDQTTNTCITGVRYLLFILAVIFALVIFLIILFSVNLNYDCFKDNQNTIRRQSAGETYFFCFKFLMVARFIAIVVSINNIFNDKMIMYLYLI